MSDIAIEAIGLSKHFKVPQKAPGLKGALQGLFARQYRDVHAVKDVSFTIQEGELVGFLGPNGAGKTTTLKILSGLLHPSGRTAHVLAFVPGKTEPPFHNPLTISLAH